MTRTDIFAIFKCSDLFKVLGLTALCLLVLGSGSALAAINCPTTTELQETYQGKCFSCLVIKSLVETFMLACSKVYGISREAGVKLLTLGSMLWLAFFGLRNVSSLTNPEGASMINQLGVFAFKVAFAYVFIVSGIGTLISYVVNPILATGAEFGVALMSMPVDTLAPENTYNGPVGIVSPDVMNKILAFTQVLSAKVANNLIIGHSLTCYAIEKYIGPIPLGVFMLRLPRIWMWLCGASIWFVGFMMTLSVSYYLMDISFKIGFAIIALPIVIGLWPFNMTAGRLKTCFSIILRAAGTFAFLAILTSMTIVLINHAYEDVDGFLAAIQNDDLEAVQEMFDITSAKFWILIFCYLTGIKLIGSAVPSMVGKFFPDEMFGDSSPMHSMATAATDWVKKQAMRPVNYAKDVAAHQGGKLLNSTVKGSVKAVRHPMQSYRSAKNNVAGGATKTAGKAAETAGRATKAAGQATKAAGKGVEAAGKGISAVGKAANAIPVVGQVVGGALIAAGSATQAAGKAVQAAGDATKKAGDVVKTAGQQLKKEGDNIKKRPVTKP